MKSLAVKVFGNVQGVWFRGSTAQKAKFLGVTGFICNRSDGSVYLEVHGSEVAIQSLLLWCEKGPTHAKVERVEVSEIPCAH